jgi:Tol biopolymer transport system component
MRSRRSCVAHRRSRLLASALTTAIVGIAAPSAAAGPAGSWCPDGSGEQLVFASAPNSFARKGGAVPFELWRIRPDGTGLRQITRVGGRNVYPTLSGDGHIVAWASSRAGERDRILLEDCETSKVHPGLHDASAEVTVPSFSPDGTKLAFVGGKSGTYDLYVVPVDGSANASLVSENVASESRPSWSPDGTRIAFGAARDGAETDVFVVDVDGTNERQLTDDPASDSEPAWSPDGTRIAFYSDRADGDQHGDQVWIMQADGSGSTRLTDESYGAYQPSWSRDGSRIAFVRNAPAHSEIYLMNPDGTHVQPLTKRVGSKADEGPTW